MCVKLLINGSYLNLFFLLESMWCVYEKLGKDKEFIKIVFIFIGIIIIC